MLCFQLHGFFGKHMKLVSASWLCMCADLSLQSGYHTSSYIREEIWFCKPQSHQLPRTRSLEWYFGNTFRLHDRMLTELILHRSKLINHRHHELMIPMPLSFPENNVQQKWSLPLVLAFFMVPVLWFFFQRFEGLGSCLEITVTYFLHFD